MTDLTRRCHDWWVALSRDGEAGPPSTLTQEAFEAGYRAALDDAARLVENEPVDVTRHNSPDALCARDEEMVRMIRALP